MVEIFKLGGMEVTKEDVVDMLTKIKRAPQHEPENPDVEEDEYVKTCDMMMLEAFFNGFITLKKREARSETRATGTCTKQREC